MISLIGFWGFIFALAIENVLYFYLKFPRPEDDKKFLSYFLREVPLFSASYVRGVVPEDKIFYFEFLVKVRFVFAAIIILGFFTGSWFG